MTKQPQININGVDIKWNPQKGTFTFFDTPSALFWINPSLLTLLQPLEKEIGRSLFCLEVAASASLGTEEDYYNMVNVLSDTFEQGFLKWGEAVSAAGWGTFEILSFDPEAKKARVRVLNTWELLMQKDLNERWGCPFIQGKIIGIFNHALKVNCWADEIIVSYDPENFFVEFDIYQSHKTISKEIEKEQQLRMHEKERLLSNKVALKTEELNLAKLEAESASLAKSRFLASMSHELRTPLNAIVGYANLLSDSPDSMTAKEYKSSIDDIKQAGGEMLTLVEQILTFSEVSINDKPIDVISFSPQETVKSAVDSILPLATNRNISLTILPQQGVQINVIANALYFKEILMIFILNAVKYIHEGGQIEIDSFINEQNWQVFRVKDNGPGIVMDKQGEIFKPFERLNHQTGAISGAGVGLSIAKMMATQMGGKIGFENNADLGATFWLKLPLEQD